MRYSLTNGLIDRYNSLYPSLPPDQRMALEQAIEAACLEDTDARVASILRIPLAEERTRSRRLSDAETDGMRRVLVGARVPREMAARCRAAADAQGTTLYAWVVKALEQALH